VSGQLGTKLSFGSRGIPLQGEASRPVPGGGEGGVEELDETPAQDSVWHTSRFCIAESVGLNSMTRVLLVRPLVWGGREAERMIVERGFKTSVESWSSQSLAGFRAIHALTRESGRCGGFASPAHVRSRAARPVSGREQTAKSFKASFTERSWQLFKLFAIIFEVVR
jgi:hypothetical protein